MPVTIAICCSEPSRPRYGAGETSAMYAGAMTDAAPTPSPPTMRQNDRSHTVKASPQPSALAMKRIAAITITRMRP